MAVWPRRRLPDVTQPVRLDGTEIRHVDARREIPGADRPMKYAANRPYADADKAARRILEIANAVELTAAARPSTARA